MTSNSQKHFAAFVISPLGDTIDYAAITLQDLILDAVRHDYTIVDISPLQQFSNNTDTPF
jgi:hypothetical protein